MLKAFCKLMKPLFIMPLGHAIKLKFKFKHTNVMQGIVRGVRVNK